MKRWKKLSAIILCIMLVTSIISGCNSSTGGENTKPVELSIVSANNTHGTTLDPAVEFCGSRNVTIGVGETLFKLNDDTLDVEKHLASDYEQVDDLTWKITIRDDVKFSNGKSVTAEAVKKAFEYTLGGIMRMVTMLDINSIEADGQVLTIKTNKIVATLPRILTDVSMFIFDTEGTEDYETGVIGTGPYILKSMDSDGNCELIKNDKYWQGTPGADRVHTKFLSDTSAATLALQSGELDYATIQAADISLFENNNDYEILDYETGRLYFLFLNSDFTFTKDPALREAMTYAFDRESYLNAVYDGRGSATTTIFPIWSGYSSDSVTQESYDIEKAKEILQDAGYEDTDRDGFLEKDGEKLTLNITSYPSNNFSVLSQAIQASLKEIGIDSEIVVSDSIVDDLQKRNFNIATYGYTTLTMGDCFNYLEPVFKTDGSSNFNNYSNPQVDVLLDELRATSDTEERKQLAIEMQKHIYEQDEHVFLIHPSNYTVVRNGIQNVTAGLGNNFNLWKVTK